MDPNLFLQKCKQQYWDKLNKAKTPWILVDAASSKHIKSAYRTAWTFIWPLIYYALALRECLENYQKYWSNRTQTFYPAHIAGQGIILLQFLLSSSSSFCQHCYFSYSLHGMTMWLRYIHELNDRYKSYGSRNSLGVIWDHRGQKG